MNGGGGISNFINIHLSQISIWLNFHFFFSSSIFFIVKGIKLKLFAYREEMNET